MNGPIGINLKGLSVFLLCTIVIMALSRNSLRERHSYGYYRFYGYEFDLLLVMATFDSWLKDPFSPLQIASWLALIFSLVLVADGLRSLGFSKATGKGKGGETELVQSGCYRYVRHPIYSSLLFLSLGTFLKSPSLFTAMLFIGASISINTAGMAEEAVNLQKFGNSYRVYMTKTKMFVPFLF